MKFPSSTERRKKSDAVHPSHYGDTLDLCEILEAIWNVPDLIAAYKFNVLKYLVRHEKKNGLEDLDKCETYLTRLMAVLDAHQVKSENAFVADALTLLARERAKYEVS